MPTTVGFGAHGSYAGLQKIAVWTDEGPERKRREKVLNWFNRTLEKNKAEKTRFNKQVDRLLHQSRTAKDAEEAQRRLAQPVQASMRISPCFTRGTLSFSRRYNFGHGTYFVLAGGGAEVRTVSALQDEARTAEEPGYA